MTERSVGGKQTGKFNSVTKEAKSRDDAVDSGKTERFHRQPIPSAYLNTDKLAARLARVFFRKTSRDLGHAHFYFKSFSDHIILLWANGKLDRVLAKSADCDKGHYTRWMKSEFSDYKRKSVFKKFHREIKRVEIDEGLVESWPSYGEFVAWLIENDQ